MVANQMAIILVQGPEEILAERQIAGIIEKLKSKDNQAVINNFSSDEVLPGMITDALAPSLFSQSRALVIKQVQDLPSECTEEIESYLENPDPELTLVLWHKGGVKGKGLVDKLKKMKADVIAVAEIKIPDWKFMQMLRPEIALISAGKENQYGHPAAQTIEGLRRMGSKIARTDKVGSISAGSGNKIHVLGKQWWQIRWR